MAYLFRLVALCALWLLSCAAWAAEPIPATVVKEYKPQYVDQWFRDVSAACSAYHSAIGPANPGYTNQNNGPAVVNGQQVCRVSTIEISTGRNMGDVNGGVAVREVFSCPGGYTLEGNMCIPDPTQCEGGRERDASGQCACKAGTKEPPGGVGACVPGSDDPNQSADQKCEQSNAMRNIVGVDRIGRINGKHPLGVPSRVCGDSGQKGPDGSPLGCVMEFTAETSFLTQSGWVSEGEALGITNGPGLACVLGLDKDPQKPEDADKVPEAKKPDAKCRNGFTGSVNGVDVCIDRGTSEQNGVDWNRVTDGDGKQTDVKTDITCKGSQCTVTQTKTPVGGGDSTVTTTNVDRTQYCRNNPKHPICGNVPTGSNTGGSGSSGTGSGGGGGTGGSGGGGNGDGDDEGSSFGGSCGAFTCEGDAIQCAIAKEQHQRACKLFDDKTDESKLYDSEVAKGTNRNVTGDLPGNETFDVASKLNMGNMLGSAQCIGDLTVTVWRRDVVLPFTKICPALAYMGWVLVAVASLAAFRIVSGSKKED